MKPVRLNRRVIYEHPRVSLYVDKVRFPQGLVVEEHHVLSFELPSVAVLVEDVDDEILLVHAYRYVTDSIEWGVPAGGVERGESLLEAAAREVREESGYQTTDHELIYSYYPMNGISDKVFDVVHCRSGRPTGCFDGNEVQDLRWASRRQLQQMIDQGEVKDGFSLTALLIHLRRG